MLHILSWSVVFPSSKVIEFLLIFRKLFSFLFVNWIVLFIKGDNLSNWSVSVINWFFGFLCHLFTTFKRLPLYSLFVVNFGTES
jgi:hypothetical protein